MTSKGQPPPPAGPERSPSHSSVESVEKRIPWPHAPTHMLAASGTYFVTAGTYLKTAPFPRAGSPVGTASRPADHRSRFRLVAGGLGCLLEPLSFRRPLAGRRRRCGKPLADASPASQEDRQVDQRLGRLFGPQRPLELPKMLLTKVGGPPHRRYNSRPNQEKSHEQEKPAWRDAGPRQPARL